MGYLTRPIIYAHSNLPFHSGPNYTRDLFTNQLEPYLKELGVDVEDFFRAPAPHIALHQAGFARNQDMILDHMESFRCVLHLHFEDFTFVSYPSETSDDDVVQKYVDYRNRIIKSLPERLERSEWLGVIITGSVTNCVLDIADIRIHSQVTVEKSNGRGIESGKIGHYVLSKKAIIR